MSTQRKNDLLRQGSILAVAGILVRLIGILYRIPMSNLLGDVGNGIYSVAYGIYGVTLTLASSSLPLAVSKPVSYTHLDVYKRQALQRFHHRPVIIRRIDKAFPAHHHRFDPCVFRPFQRIRFLVGRHHQCDLPIGEHPGLLRVDQRLQIGSAAGNQNRNFDHTLTPLPLSLIHIVRCDL